MKFWLSSLSLLALSSLSPQSARTNAFVPASQVAPKEKHLTIPGISPDLIKDNGGHFTVVEYPSERGTTVLEAPVSQDGVQMFIAFDTDSFCNTERPGNGGIRLLNYKSTKHAVDDAVRLAKGMTRKHDMFR